jgi:hypothetical protein
VYGVEYWMKGGVHEIDIGVYMGSRYDVGDLHEMELICMGCGGCRCNVGAVNGMSGM